MSYTIKSRSTYRGLHHLVRDWRVRVVAHGGSVDDSTLDLVSNCMRKIEDWGLLPSIYRMNLFCGNNLRAALTPIIAKVGYPIEKNTTFGTADYSLADGLKGDGVFKNLRTGATSRCLDAASAHMMFYGRAWETTGTGLNYCGIGVSESLPNPGLECQIYTRRSNNRIVWSCGATADAAGFKEVGSSYNGHLDGFLMGSTTALTGSKSTCLYYQGLLESEGVSSWVRTRPAAYGREIAVFARNFNENNALRQYTSAYGFAYSFGAGMNRHQVGKYHRALWELMQGLGRCSSHIPISCWGDSLTIGSGGTPYWHNLFALLTPTDRGIQSATPSASNIAVNKAEYMLATDYNFDHVHVHWYGHHDVNGNIEALIADIDDMIATSNGKYVIMSCIQSSSEPNGSANATWKQNFNSALAAHYGDRYLDIRAYLLTQGNGSSQDNADVANGITPTSLRADTIHLTTAGYLKVAEQVATKIQTLNW